MENDPDDPKAWMNLGEAYQTRDVNYHEGGRNQPKALHAYRMALDIGIEDYMRGDLYLKIGLLHYTMGQALEAVKVFDAMIEVSSTTEEFAKALYHKGISLQMLGSIELAISTFQQILQIDAEYLSAYKPMIDCFLERSTKIDSWMWTELHDDVLRVLRRKHPNVFVSDIVDRDLTSLWISKIASDSSIPSDVFFALTTISSQLKQITLAWKYLEIGHKLELRRRPKYDPHKPKHQAASIIGVFQRNFWPSGVGSSSTIPVFIVGQIHYLLVEGVLLSIFSFAFLNYLLKAFCCCNCA